ncbi:MAG: hypothetical protein Q9167_001737 [Letrouitia subvulpina]
MANKFNIQPVNRFENASIRRPKEFTHFSYDDDYELHFDDRSVRYYYPPNIGADLCRGFESFQKRDDTVDNHIDGLVKSIMNFEQKSGTECKTDIVTWRGLITKLLATAYDETISFEMNATKFQVGKHVFG